MQESLWKNDIKQFWYKDYENSSGHSPPRWNQIWNIEGYAVPKYVTHVILLDIN